MKPLTDYIKARPEPRTKQVKSVLWKPTVIPAGFTLLRDTREQSPFLFPNYPELHIVDTKLDDGDYSVLGMEDKLAIERKQMSDFCSYLGRERKTRTERKLERLREFYFAGLVVETGSGGIYDTPMQSLIDREQVRGFLKALQVKYGIHLYYSEYRSDCERWVLDTLTYGFEKLRSIQQGT